jgi:hypothetical protein
MRLKPDTSFLTAGPYRPASQSALTKKAWRRAGGLSALALLAAFQMAPSAALAQPYRPAAQTDPDAAYVPPSLPPNIAYELKAATAIPAVMVSGISPGQTNEIEAQTTADVYDSQTGQDLLIPQGSKLLGSVDPSSLHEGNYELVQWNQIVLPTGLYLNVQSDPNLLLRSAVDANDQVEGRFVNIPTAAPFATVFFTPDSTPDAPITIPAGVLFNVMLTKDIHINPQGVVIPPVLTPAALPSAYGQPQGVTPMAAPVAAPASPQTASVTPIPAVPADPPPAQTKPVVANKPVNITSILDSPPTAAPKPLPPLKTVAVSDPDAAYVPPPGMEPDSTPASGDGSGASASAPAAPPAPPPPPKPIWYLNANSLVGTDLKSWAKQAGWTVIWQANQDWPVPTTTHFQGDFQTVAAQVLNDLAEQGANIRGKFYTGNQTLVISQPGDSDAQ